MLYRNKIDFNIFKTIVNFFEEWMNESYKAWVKAGKYDSF
jgi:hypothetical protein